MPKFVLVTSIGTGDSQGAPPPQVYEALKPVLLQKVKAEDKLKELAAANGMEFCIVRPGGLKSEPATGTGVLTEDVNICGAIHHADVASLVVKCVLKDSANGKVLSCVDKEQLFDAKRFASALRDSLLNAREVAGPPARGGGLRSFPGGLPQQTVASVDHRETPQQFDRWQPLISIRDLLMGLALPRYRVLVQSLLHYLPVGILP